MRRAAIPLLVVGVLLCACSGTVGEEPVRVRDGILAGTITRGAVSGVVLAYARQGRFMAVDRSAAIFYDGTYVVSDDEITSSNLRVYATDSFGLAVQRAYTETASLSAKISGTGWSGTITRPGSTEALSLTYDRGVYSQDSSLTFTEGTWSSTSGGYTSTLAITLPGATSTTNNTDNCASTGTLSILNENANIYGAVATAAGSSCGTRAGAYSGFASLVEDTDPLDTLVLFLAKADVFTYGIHTRQ